MLYVRLERVREVETIMLASCSNPLSRRNHYQQPPLMLQQFFSGKLRPAPPSQWFLDTRVNRDPSFASAFSRCSSLLWRTFAVAENVSFAATLLTLYNWLYSSVH